MVYAYACSYSHGSTCVVSPVGKACYGGCQVSKHAEGTILCLVACSKSCTSCGRVGDAVACALGVYEGGVGERGEAKLVDAYASLHCCEIGLGTVYLVYAHAVANEIENILGLVLGHDGKCEHKDAAQG